MHHFEWFWIVLLIFAWPTLLRVARGAAGSGTAVPARRVSISVRSSFSDFDDDDDDDNDDELAGEDAREPAALPALGPAVVFAAPAARMPSRPMPMPSRPAPSRPAPAGAVRDGARGALAARPALPPRPPLPRMKPLATRPPSDAARIVTPTRLRTETAPWQ